MPIRNPVMFIGQKILAAVVGSPLSSDANGQLVSGTSNSETVGTSTITTTSATDVLITGMTATPVAGTYIVWFVTTLQHITNNANIFVSIYAGGVQASGSEMEATPQIQGGVTPSLNMRVPIATVNTVAVNGSQAIEARWRTSAGTATATTRTLQILRVL